MKDRIWFNRKLFWDTVRQLRVMGITYLAICFVISVMPPILMSFEGYSTSVSIELLTPILYLFMTVGTVTMVFCAFSHLFSRRASDYFDALPTKRAAVALSRFSAVMAWIWAIVFVTVVSAVFSYGLLCGMWHWNYVPWLCGYHGVISLFFAAACLCGVSLAGTRFSAFIVGGLVAFILRFLLLQFASTITYFAPVVSYKGFGMLLNPYMNIATATTMAPFGTNEIADPYSIVRMITSIGPMLYTLGVGLVYLALGIWLYHIRKSETAGKSAPNRTLQTLYRCGITMPIILTFVMEFFMARSITERDMPALIITALVSSLMVYLIFEVITQKRLKGLWKTLPYYAVLMAFCVLFVLAGKTVALSQQNIAVNAEDVNGIVLMDDRSYGYTDFMLRDLVLQDEQITGLIIGALQSNIQTNVYTDASDGYSRFATVRIHLKSGGTLIRNVGLTEEQSRLLKTLLIGNAQYMQRERQLPDADQIESFSIGVQSKYEPSPLSQEQMQTLYGLLIADMQTLSDKDFDSLLSNTGWGYDWDSAELSKSVQADILQIQGYVGFESFSTGIAITPLTPNAMAYYLGIVQQDANQMLLKYLPAAPRVDCDMQFTLILYDLSTGRAVEAIEIIQTDASGQATLGDKKVSAYALMRQAAYQSQTGYLLQIEVAEAAVQSESYEERSHQGTFYVYLTQEQAQTMQTLLEFK